MKKLTVDRQDVQPTSQKPHSPTAMSTLSLLFPSENPSLAGMCRIGVLAAVLFASCTALEDNGCIGTEETEQTSSEGSTEPCDDESELANFSN